MQFRRKDRHETVKFCGNFDRLKSSNSVSDYTVDVNNVDEGSNIYGEFDAEGEIETTIFVSKKSLNYDDMPLNITIVYTPYKGNCNIYCFYSIINNNYFIFRILY